MPSGTPNWHPKIPKCPPPPRALVVIVESSLEFYTRFEVCFPVRLKQNRTTLFCWLWIVLMHSQWYLETVCAKWLFLLSEKQMFSRSEARLWVKLYRTMFVRRYVVCYILCFINDVTHTSEILRRNVRLNSLLYSKRFRYYNFINESQFSSWPTAQDFLLFFQFSHEN